MRITKSGNTNGRIVSSLHMIASIAIYKLSFVTITSLERTKWAITVYALVGWACIGHGTGAYGCSNIDWSSTLDGWRFGRLAFWIIFNVHVRLLSRDEENRW